MRPSSHRGSIPADGVVTLLRDLEASRVSGLLAYTSAEGVHGEVWLRLGQIDPSQPEAPDGTDPVESFLSLRGGSFEVIESLPPLEGSEGSLTQRRGSLGRHSVPDLMNYAEAAGLSGVVRVEREQRVAEIVYAEGTLVAIYLDGSSDEVDEVFGWTDGAFVVKMKGSPSLLPPAPEKGAAVDLPSPRILERPLGELLEEASARRPRPLSIAPARSIAPPRRESTVRIVMLGGSGEALFQSRSMVPPPRSLIPTAPPRPPTSGSNAAVATPDEVVPRPPATPHERRSHKRIDAIAASDEPVLPRWAVAVLAVLLVAGIGAFVASLLTMG